MKKDVLMAEKLVLGSLLFDSTSIDSVKDVLSPEMFTDSKHGQIYATILDLFNLKKKFDVNSVGLSLPDEMGYLLDLKNLVNSSAEIKEYAQIITDLFSKNKILQVLKNTESNMGNLTLEEVIESLKDVDESLVSWKPESSPLFEDDDITNMASITSFPTQFHDFNEASLPCAGDMIVIGAASSTGKTAFGLNIAIHYAERGQKVLFFSCEMTKLSLVPRAYAYLGYGRHLDIRSAYRGDSRFTELIVDIEKYKDRDRDRIKRIKENLYVRSGDVTVTQIKKEVAACGYPPIIVVDYIQEIRTTEKQSRYLELAGIAHELKAIAMDNRHPCVMFAMSQMTYEKNADGKIVNARAREASDVYNICDTFIDLIDTEYDANSVKTRRFRPIDVNMRKARNGTQTKFSLKFDADCQKFLVA